MLNPSQWWLVRAPVDLRAGMDRLLALTVSMLGHDVREGGAYVFRNRAGSRIKVLCLDGQGVWLCVRRLHEGSFHWPSDGDAAWALSIEQFQWLCAGVNWQRLSTRLSALPGPQ